MLRTILALGFVVCVALILSGCKPKSVYQAPPARKSRS